MPGVPFFMVYNIHFQLAARAAIRSDSKFRLGAVLARRTRAISIGWNDMGKTHPVMNKFSENKPWSPGIHAEIDACLGVNRDDLDGAQIYVVRLKRDGSLGMARPCGVCARILKDMRIEIAYFSTGQGFGEYTL